MLGGLAIHTLRWGDMASHMLEGDKAYRDMASHMLPIGASCVGVYIMAKHIGIVHT